MITSGALGKPRSITTLLFSDWLYRPRSAEELDPTPGEGLVYRQGPVQADIVRMLGGGLVRSVRATTSASDPDRPIEGGYTAFADFDNGAVATLVYSGYGFFDSAELTFGIGLQGYPVEDAAHVKSHALIAGFASRDDEFAYKDATRYGGSRHTARRATQARAERRHAFFGLTLVSRG